MPDLQEEIGNGRDCGHQEDQVHGQHLLSEAPPDSNFAGEMRFYQRLGKKEKGSLKRLPFRADLAIICE